MKILSDSNTPSFLLQALIHVVGIGAAMLGAYPIVASSAVINIATAISSTNTTYDNQDLIVDATTLTIDGSHTFTNISLINGAKLTHTAASATKLVLTANQLTIDATSSVDISGKGSTASGSGLTGYSGGSHGGRGGNFSGVSNPSHGVYTAPVDFGTGGGAGNGVTTRGGGAIKIVANQLTLNGSLLANGDGSNALSYTGGGSGGSVWLDVGVLTGAGTITASGGNAAVLNEGGGGGGRIAIYYTDVSGFDLQNKVHNIGGTGYTAVATGGAGTVYIKNKAATLGELRINNEAQPSNLGTTELSGTIPEPIYLNNGQLLLIGATTINTVASSNNNSTVTSTGSLTGQDLVVNGWTYVASAPQVWNSIQVINGGKITSLLDSANISYPLQLTATTITVDATSSIDVTGKGKTFVAGLTGYSGGSYGGRGGNFSGVSNPTLGNYQAPVDFGTGGGAGNGVTTRGAGAIKIVADQLTLNGSLLANGGGSNAVSYTGGGSGGSIWLDVGVLTGAGTITASGGNATAPNEGGGGGGRIAIYYTDTSGFDLQGKIHNTGGVGYTSVSGGAGTIFTKDKAFSAGILKFNNESVASDLTATAIDSTNLAFENENILVVGTVLSIDGTHTFSSMQLVSGAKLTHPVAPASKLSVTLASLTVDATSSINVNGKGNNSSASGLTGYSGGSHGGRGGNFLGVSNPSHGVYTAPVDFGTGGGAGNGVTTRGGGAIKIVANQLMLNGSLLANGDGSNAVSYTGGGSGGSVWLDVGVLTGSGTITASGGNATAPNEGGGGGGRIAIYYTDVSGFDLQNKVHNIGGTGYTAVATGGAGTVYIKNKAATLGELRINNEAQPSNLGTTELSGTIPEPIYLNNAQLLFIGQTTINTVVATNSTVTSTSSLMGQDLVVNGWTYVASAPQAWNSIQVVNGGKITSLLDIASNTSYPLQLTAGSITVDATSSIDVSGKGNRYVAGLTGYSGGSYGGRGGNYSGVSNSTFGDYQAPIDFGTGGGVANSLITRGGGAIKIVADQLTLNGSLLSNGGESNGVSYTGAGSGGSIWLDVGVLTGAGTITASGGNATGVYGGGGGGGRIAIHYTDVSGFDLQNNAHNIGGMGYTAVSTGGAGTFYTKNKAASLGELRINNETRAITAATTDLTGSIPVPLLLNNAQVVFLGATSITSIHGANNSTVTAMGTLSAVNGTMLLDAISLTLKNPVTATTLQVINGGKITSLLDSSTNTPYPLQLTAGSITVDATSSIDVSGKGNRVVSGLSGYSGGSYGGRGGNYSGVSNSTFGDYQAPIDFGTGGGVANSLTTRGGGAIKIVADQLTLNGSLLSNGGESNGVSYTGVGSGGSIWLDVGILTGAGTITASGGNATGVYGGGGGGGRIAIYYTDVSGYELVTKVTNLGGTGYAGANGEPGTIYTHSKLVPFYVISSTPTGLLNQPVSTIMVRFSAEIDPATFTIDDVVISGPQGAVTAASVTQLDTINYTINLAGPINISGAYSVNIGPNILTPSASGMDQDHNGVVGEIPGDVYTSTFVTDLVMPAAPGITSHAPAPTVTTSTTNVAAVSGTREDNTAIWINGTVRVTEGSGAWSTTINLPQGDSMALITAKDTAGNESAPATLLFSIDSIAPVVTSLQPAHGSDIKVRPTAIRIGFSETGSGLDVPGSSFAVTRNATAVAGTWSTSTSEVVFTPTNILEEGSYQTSVQLKDMLGLQSPLSNYTFVLDLTAPVPPVVNAMPMNTNINQQVITGTKEADTSLWMNGLNVIGLSASPMWSYTASLVVGSNAFSFTTRDRAGNESQPKVVTITYDNIAPAAVVPTAISQSDGISVKLDWSAYDEVSNGNDISTYRIYMATSAFTDVSGMLPLATTNAGKKTYIALGLVRNQQYYFAVVAVDLQGNRSDTVTAVQVTTKDTKVPEEITGLRVDSYDNRLVLNWTASANTAGDLANYKVYVDSSSTTLASTATNHEITGLSSATSYALKVTAVDADNNQSVGVSITGVTLLSNPASITADPLSGQVSLAWSAVSPAGLVKNYAIYASTVPFSTVDGLTPKLLVSGSATTTKLAGLVNGTLYYFGVTAINLSGGERKSVANANATPQADIAGPVVSNLSFAGTALVDGATITKSGSITLTATDQSGVGRTEFALDGAVFATDTNGSANYSALFDVLKTTDGPHTVSATVYDTLGNSTTISKNVSVALAAPAAPTITAPVNNATTNQPLVTVSGRTEKLTEVFVYVNAAQAAGPIAVNSNGDYSIPVTLAAGANAIQTAARNRGGLGPMSVTVNVTLDTTIPDAPAGLAAQSRESGVIRLVWNTITDNSIAGYHLYRATAAFADISQATKITTNPIVAATYDDVLAVDAHYYYRVVAVNKAGTAGAASNIVSAIADSGFPKALSIEYQPKGSFDATSGRMGPGQVDVIVTVNEPLLAAPFLSIAPQGGVPISITLALSAQSTTEYKGAFDIKDTTPSGTAYAVFSARDLIGNRGTDITGGATIQIDTVGPLINSITLTPTHPIKNDSVQPVLVDVGITLSDAVKPGTTPQLSYLLSGAGRQPAVIDNLVSTGATTWSGSFILPADAGLAVAETMQFQYSGADDLTNVSTKINGRSTFQVYQGNLPPADVPSGLAAQALKNGQVHLTWVAVDETVAYQLYRQAPGESVLTAYQRVGTITSFIASNTSDGAYRYAIASIRQDNDQETMSTMSVPVDVNADATPPNAPTNLALQLAGNGIKATWQSPVTGDVQSYALYRSSTATITSVAGLMPIKTGITGLSVVDASPSVIDHAYIVTAVDAAGNESTPSNSFYLNFSLLPVASLSVEQVADQAPVVSWTHASNTVAGYQVYLGSFSQSVKVNSQLYTATTYIDAGFSGDERVYTVIAVDNANAQSIGRTLLLPKLSAKLDTASTLRRGIMNRLNYTIVNSSAVAITGIRVKVAAGAHPHTSEVFNLTANETRMVPVIVGGYGDLADLTALTTTVQIIPNEGEEIRIVRTSHVEVTDSAFPVGLATEQFTRGGAGKVRFTLQNTSDAEIEIVTATKTGSAVSDEVKLKLVDADGNVLSLTTMKQAIGASVVTLTNGKTVARVAPGAAFTSDAIDLPVPSSASDYVEAQLEISQFRYHTGKVDEVVISGMQTSQAVVLSNTSYTCEVQLITPTNSYGDKDVVITGRALARDAGAPVAGAPVSVVLQVNGFERVTTVYTDSSGDFRYSFTPLVTESGVYIVSCVHPDLSERPNHGQFTIGRVILKPTKFSLRIPLNYEYSIPIIVTAGDSTQLSNVRFVYTAADQPLGTLPAGVTVDTGAAMPLASKQTATINVKVRADNIAAKTGALIVKLVSDETGAQSLGKVQVEYTFSEANPALYFTPNYLETGLAQGTTITEVITLENKGLADLNDMTLALLTESGAPAPSWVMLLSRSDQGTLAVGEPRPINIGFNPAASLAEGIYAFKLRVTGSNSVQSDINIYASVTQSGVGNLLFKASDIYTATLNSSGQPIQGLAGARIRVQNEAVISVEQTLTTDSGGEALFTDLPAGSYRYRASAANHEDLLGSFYIKPGLTAAQDIFLNYNLVTVEWSVTEIPLQDKYEITLNATFETNVPAAVVVMEPASVKLPVMKPGDIFYGEYVLTNHGLIRADTLKFSMPVDDKYFLFETLIDAPNTLDAKQSITIPYRIVSVTSLDTSTSGAATGGGCSSWRAMSKESHSWACANGSTSSGSSTSMFFGDTGSSASCGSGGGAGGGASGGGGGGGGSSGTSGGPAYNPVSSGGGCTPSPDEGDEGQCNAPDGNGDGGS